MVSDSWLSKNIRPLALAVTGITIYVLAFLSIFTELTELQLGALDSWIGILGGVFGAMIAFYFGSRGIEKVKQIGFKINK